MADDEELVRLPAKNILERYGYRVLTAGDGREALQMLTQSPAIRLVLLDLTMPVLGGDEVAPLLRARRPDLKIVITSGYSAVEASRLLKDHGIDAFIEKPYTAVQLAEKVKLALTDRSARASVVA